MVSEAGVDSLDGGRSERRPVVITDTASLPDSDYFISLTFPSAGSPFSSSVSLYLTGHSPHCIHTHLQRIHNKLVPYALANPIFWSTSRKSLRMLWSFLMLVGSKGRTCITENSEDHLQHFTNTYLLPHCMFSITGFLNTDTTEQIT